MKKHKHDVVVFSLQKQGHLSACLKCKKVLMKPENLELDAEEIDVLIEFARHVRKEGGKRGKQKVDSKDHKKRTS